MPQEHQPANPPLKVPWHDTAWFKWGAIGVLVGVICVKCILVLAFKNKGQDFAWHLRLGQTALEGTPYVMPDGKLVGDHYLPGRVLIDAMGAMLTLKGAQAVSLALTLFGLCVMARLWGRMADGVRPATVGLHQGAFVLAFALMMPWTLRDFDEAGLQFLLLLMLTVAGWCIYTGRQLAGGVWLALAITFKSTPLLFLPLLLYKRQWAAASATVLFLVVFNVVVPGIIWGPAKTQEALGRYWAKVQSVSKVTDPSENGIETPKHQNQNLPFAMARYLQTYPPGHPLFFHEKFDGDPERMKAHFETDPAMKRPHWGFVQFLDLDARTAKRVIMGTMGLIALALAWRMRRRWGIAGRTAQEGEAAANAKTSALAPEWAVACAFAALMSPLTWLHHLALVLPCMYLVIRDLLQGGCKHARIRWIAFGLVALCLLLQRDVLLPKQLALLMMSYHEDVLACLILVVMALTVKEMGTAGAGGVVESQEPTQGKAI